jgi:hypothetical protein
MSENRHVPRRRRAACSVQWSRLWLGFYTVPLDARDGCATDSWAVFRRSSRDVPIAESAPALSPHPPYRVCRHRGGNVTTSVVRLSLVASDGPVGSTSSCHRHHTVFGCCGKIALFTVFVTTVKTKRIKKEKHNRSSQSPRASGGGGPRADRRGPPRPHTPRAPRPRTRPDRRPARTPRQPLHARPVGPNTDRTRQ